MTKNKGYVNCELQATVVNQPVNINKRADAQMHACEVSSLTTMVKPGAKERTRGERARNCQNCLLKTNSPIPSKGRTKQGRVNLKTQRGPTALHHGNQSGRREESKGNREG